MVNQSNARGRTLRWKPTDPRPIVPNALPSARFESRHPCAAEQKTDRAIFTSMTENKTPLAVTGG